MATRYFHWDAVSDCVMHETDGAGATTVEYTHEPGAFGPLLSETRSGVESYHHYDALGSTTALSDPTGAVTDTFQYDAWGNQVARTGTTPTPYTWVGRWGYQHDTPTSGYYIRARSYQPTVARWMSVDPRKIRFYENRYVYVRSTPLQMIDPSGLKGKTVWGGEKGCEDVCKAILADDDYRKIRGAGGVYCLCTAADCDKVTCVKCACLFDDSDLDWEVGKCKERDKCAIAHEKQHFKDVNCDKSKRKIDRPEFKEGVDPTERECELRKNDIDCFKKSIKKDPAGCKANTEYFIELQEKYIKDECKKNKKKP